MGPTGPGSPVPPPPYGSPYYGPSPSPAPRRPGRRGAIAAVVAVVVIVAAVGSVVGVVADRHHKASVQRAAAAASASAAAAKASAAAQAQKERELAAYQAAKSSYKQCTGQVGDLVKALTNLDADLDVGINEGDYMAAVRDVSKAYGEIDVDTLSPGCLKASVPLENAFNAYNAAAQTWDNCLWTEDDCTTDSIQPTLQAKWAKASSQITTAKTRLAALNPDDPSYTGTAIDPAA